MAGFSEYVSFIWSVADLLRGDYKQSEYGKVILPLVLIRRLDCVLEPTKEQVITESNKRFGQIDNLDPILRRITGYRFYNTSALTLSKVTDDPTQIAPNLRAYIAGFSPNAAEVIQRFSFEEQISRLDRSNILYMVVSKFTEIDLHPDKVSNIEMGMIFEELIRRFSEQSNETAGEHFTPREVIRLMVNLIFATDSQLLTTKGKTATLYDPACGTGGMLSVAQEYLREFNQQADLVLFGQELNDESYAICRSDMMLKGQDPANIHPGNSFVEDGTSGQHFDYMLSNPPFGVEWKKVETQIKDEASTLGFNGRFGAGLPRINDGSFLFLQHMLSKMKPVSKGGSRLAIVFNGSPMFTGSAGSGESEIRRWIIESDYLEAVVALPDQLFYNTGISTYIWVLSNRKQDSRKGKIQLIDAREFFQKMRKSLGDKRKAISSEQIEEITHLYADYEQTDKVKIFPNYSFGTMRITVERPLRLKWEVNSETISKLSSLKQWTKLSEQEQSELVSILEALDGISTTDKSLMSSKIGVVPKTIEKPLWNILATSDPDAPIVLDKKGRPEPDPNLRDSENVPLPQIDVNWEVDPTNRLQSDPYIKAIDEYMKKEVLSFIPDAWVDYSKTKIGYEIPLTRHFYKYIPPRPLDEIDAEIKDLEQQIQDLLGQVTQ